ncbi:branched-chain amino acid ABC transporter permease [Hypericibacter adhaerens]|uniref:branched-chain amino acid ABC transporter permease n=1 Tax=Hypericibacter adhaerens TaxID=2602016 RepID=UPI0012453465|nr:branched-chain amino acid ABC transporter permease [Hypericibacter adhaerens]
MAETTGSPATAPSAPAASAQRPIIRPFPTAGILSVAFLLFVAWAAVVHTQLLVAGIVTGSIYAIGAVGLSIVYGVLRFPNMAHGLGMMLAGYLTFFFYTGRLRRSALVIGDVRLPFNFGKLPGASEKFLGLSFGYGMFFAMIASAAVISLVLILIDRWVYRPARRRRSHVSLMLTTLSFGTAYVLFGMIAIGWGTLPRSLTEGIHRAIEYPFGIQIKADQQFVIVGAIVSAIAAYLVLYGTKLGRAMRAVTDNPDLARLSGVNIERVIIFMWVLVGCLTTAAGTLAGLQAQLTPQLGLSLVLPLFTAAALGGIGSPIGALLGGLAVGILQEVSVAFVAPGYKLSVAFAVLIVVLVLKPFGGGRRAV